MSEVDKCKHNKTVYEECLDCHWNAAIEAAAEIADEDHGSCCEEVGNKIRKLKK